MSAVLINTQTDTAVRAHWKGFRRIANLLKLSNNEKDKLLQLSSLHQLAYWQSKGDDIYLSVYQVERLSYVLAIFQAASDLMSDQETFIRWARMEVDNSYLKNQTPISYMMESDNKGLNELCAWLANLPSSMEAFNQKNR